MSKDFFEATNITFYDLNDKPVIFIDGVSGKQLVLGEFGCKQVIIDKLTHSFLNVKTRELKELDFSNISDEDWLKLKNLKIKKIVLDVPID